MPKPPKNPAGDYEVGYGRPPAHSQFKPGHSGNREGRPKGQPNMAEIFMREAARVVRIQVGDKVESISKIEAIFRKLFSMALAGDTRALGMILTVQTRMDTATSESGQEAIDEQNLDMAIPDDDALRRMLSRFDHLRPD